jgi:hypothetical protein
MICLNYKLYDNYKSCPFVSVTISEISRYLGSRPAQTWNERKDSQPASDDGPICRSVCHHPDKKKEGKQAEARREARGKESSSVVGWERHVASLQLLRIQPTVNL